MQVRIRFVNYGFIAPKINTPKCTYVIHKTQNLSARSNFRNFKNAYTRKSSNLQQVLNVPTKSRNAVKLCALQLKCLRSPYKSAGTFFLPFTFNKAKKKYFKLLFFLTLSLPAQECVPAFFPSLFGLCRQKKVRTLYVARKSCTKILFHVIV